MLPFPFQRPTPAIPICLLRSFRLFRCLFAALLSLPSYSPLPSFSVSLLSSLSFSPSPVSLSTLRAHSPLFFLLSFSHSSPLPSSLFLSIYASFPFFSPLCVSYPMPLHSSFPIHLFQLPSFFLRYLFLCSASFQLPIRPCSPRSTLLFVTFHIVDPLFTTSSLFSFCLLSL